MSKRKAPDSLPRWAHLIRFQSDKCSEPSDLQSSTKDIGGTVRRRRKSAPTTATTTLTEPPMKKQHHSNYLDASLLPHISYEREDLYLRLEAFRYASAMIDRQLIHSMQHVFTNDSSQTPPSLLDSWIKFVKKFEPEEMKNNSDSSIPAVDDDVVAQDKATLENFIHHHRYHPTLLPVTIFHFSSLALDRDCIIQFLSSQYKVKMTRVDHEPGSLESSSSSSSSRRPAICILQYGSFMSAQPEYESPSSSSSSSRMQESSTSSHSYSTGFNSLSFGCTLKTFFKDILKQCIAQEEPQVQESFQYLLQKDGKISKKQHKLKYKKGIHAHSSYRHRLVHWAQRTDSFHSIVVILENPEIIPLETLNSFIASVSHLRDNDFVPIQLVICSMSYSPSRWRMLESFTGNVVVQDIHVPPSTDLLNHLLNRLYHIPQGKDDKTYPILPSKEILRNLRVQFNDFHGSILSFLHQLKSALAHHFARKGSFLALTDESSFTSHHGKRMAWFCLDQNARSYLMSSSTISSDGTSSHVPSSTLMTFIDAAIQDQRFLFLIIKLVHFAHSFLVNRTTENRIDGNSSTTLLYPENAVEACICLSDEYRQRVTNILDKLGQMQLSDLVVFIIQGSRLIQHMLDDSTMTCSPFRKSVEDLIYGYTDTDARKPSTGVLRDPEERVRRLLQWTHENIILIHSLLQENSEESLIPCMSKETIASLESSLKQDIITTLDNLFHRISFDWCVSSPFSLLRSLADRRSNNLVSGTSFLQSILALPRRHVSLGIREKIITSNVDLLGNDVCMAFSVMNVRVIDIATWFTRFTNEIHQVDDGKIEKSANGLETNRTHLQRFTFAVYQLIHMGIVSKSSRSDDIYEKLAMVWLV